MARDRMKFRAFVFAGSHLPAFCPKSLRPSYNRSLWARYARRFWRFIRAVYFSPP
jgi:hypothetical protein